MSQEIPEGYIVKSTRFHGPNVVSCEIVSGNQLTPLIGSYLPPSTLDHLPHLEEALNPFPDRDPIILGGLNADIIRLRNPREQQVAYFLAYFGLVCLLAHFYNTFAIATYRRGGRSARSELSDTGVT